MTPPSAQIVSILKRVGNRQSLPRKLVGVHGNWGIRPGYADREVGVRPRYIIDQHFEHLDSLCPGIWLHPREFLPPPKRFKLKKSPWKYGWIQDQINQINTIFHTYIILLPIATNMYITIIYVSGNHAPRYFSLKHRVQ